MKALLLSIQPKWIAKILNGEKTIEVRKRFPEDYKGWVYIYCTKDVKDYLIYYDFVDISFDTTIGERESGYFIGDKRFANEDCNNETHFNLNGKVVARFYCDKVEELTLHFDYTKEDGGWFFYTNDDLEIGCKNINDKSCLDNFELLDYCNGKGKNRIEGKKLYAIHISQLEIFDKPKELREFDKHNFKGIRWDLGVGEEWDKYRGVLTKAPSTFCYVEV